MPVVMGVGVIIVNASGEVLFGQRCGSHAPYWSIPGGHMEPGEGFTEAAIREVAEETGLIVPISDWVMLPACREATGWDADVFISVNLSPVEFYCGDLIARVSNVLQETGICPARVELEITESVMMEDADQALVIMRGLKALGIRLSMDDFGTGYSSLSYLRLYPFDGLKIDRSFIANLDDSQSSQAIIQSVVGLGRAMSLTVTAEGVETSAQLDELLRVNCHQAQGFLLGRPMSVAALKALMKTPLHQP